MEFGEGGVYAVLPYLMTKVDSLFSIDPWLK